MADELEEAPGLVRSRVHIAGSYEADPVRHVHSISCLRCDCTLWRTTEKELRESRVRVTPYRLGDLVLEILHDDGPAFQPADRPTGELGPGETMCTA